MYLCTELAVQPALLHVARQAAAGAIRDLPSLAECVVAARLLVVSGSKGSEAAARESLSLSAPIVVHTNLYQEEAEDVHLLTNLAVFGEGST